MSVLPFLSILSVIITSIAWKKQRSKENTNTGYMSPENFILLNNKWVSRRNNGLLIVDAFVTAYFAIVTPDVPGYFYILLLSTIATVHSIMLSLAGLHEKQNGAPSFNPAVHGQPTHHLCLLPLRLC